MKGRRTARNMYSRNINKIGTQCVCWCLSQGKCSDFSAVTSIPTSLLANILARHSNARRTLPIRPSSPPSISFPVHYTPIILPFHVTLLLLKTLLNNSLLITQAVAMVLVMSVGAFTDNMIILKGRNFESKGFLVTFGKFRKATFSFAMSVQPSVRLSIGIEQLGHPWTN